MVTRVVARAPMGKRHFKRKHRPLGDALGECQRPWNELLLATFPSRAAIVHTMAPVADSQRSSDPPSFITSARADSQRRWLPLQYF
jgi:hypothetical protein